VIVCAAANPSIDRLFEVKRLLPGEIHRPASFLQVPGGKGLNVARATACLDEPVHAVALVGGHAGRWVAEGLAAGGIDASLAWCEGETRSSLTVLDTADGGLTEFYERGSAVSGAEWDGFEQAVAEVLPGADWLTLSGSLPPGAPEDGYARLIVHARSAGLRVALDSRGAALAHGLTSGPDVVKVNVAEAEETLGASLAARESALAGAVELARLCPQPPRLVVVTRGAEGLVAVDDVGRGWSGRSAGGGRYPVGSGDAFLAGLVTALARGEEWPRPLALALAAGAANAELPGPGRLDAARAQQLAATAELTPVLNLNR
jgi:1-phosphofructokinase family hexose kinase